MGQVIRFIILAAPGVFLAISGGIALVSEFYFTGGIAAAAGLYILLSIKVVGPAEMAILVILGRPVGFKDSGLRFVPWLIASLARYPKKTYNFNFTAREAITQAGTHKGVNYGAQVVKVDTSVYLNFPREFRRVADGEAIDDDTHPLIKILRAEVPVADAMLEKWVDEAVLAAVRVAVGRITWRQASEDIDGVTRAAEEIFKREDGALIRAGFSSKGIRLVVDEITLPEALERALPEVDRQRLEAEAAPFEAEQRAEETMGAMVRMLAKSTGRDFTAVQAEIARDAVRQAELREFAKDLVTRRMSLDGRALTDIRLQGGPGDLGNAIAQLIALLKVQLGSGGGSPAGGAEPRVSEAKELPFDRERQERLRKVTDEVRKRGG